jgi:hypothetical protein
MELSAAGEARDFIEYALIWKIKYASWSVYLWNLCRNTESDVPFDLVHAVTFQYKVMSDAAFATSQQIARRRMQRTKIMSIFLATNYQCWKL